MGSIFLRSFGRDSDNLIPPLHVLASIATYCQECADWKLYQSVSRDIKMSNYPPQSNVEVLFLIDPVSQTSPC